MSNATLSDSPANGPIELAELLRRGCTLNGDPVGEIYARSMRGGVLQYEWPSSSSRVMTTEEQPPRIRALCEKIKAYLQAVPRAVKTKELEDTFQPDRRGGDLSLALKHLREIGEVFTRNGKNTEDASKFDFETR